MVLNLDNEKDYQEKKTMTMTKNYRNVKIADMLVEKGSDPKLENNLGATVFHLAAKSNSEQLIKYLISKFNHLINYSDKKIENFGKIYGLYKKNA